jgi:aerobic carbon-monoxide dehydrogenase small subunit
MKINLVLNGRKVGLEAPPDQRVVDLLRQELHLTGTKEGCGAGECGACTILVNGQSRLSCLMLVAQLDGANVTTIEGLTADGTLHPIQQAFIDHGAVQCGFCSPGMVLSAVDLLHRQPQPCRADIRQGLSGNLCRCTGYQKIIDAVEAVTRTVAASCSGTGEQQGKS